MKIAAQILCGTLLAALAMNSASAEPVTVKVTGQVVRLTGTAGTILEGVALGQSVSATYSYDTNTPDLNVSPTSGTYEPTAAQGASVRVEMGWLVFESLPTSAFDADVYVFRQPPFSGHGIFTFNSSGNRLLVDGSPVDTIALSYFDNGTVLTSDALPAIAPDGPAFSNRELFVSGGPWSVSVDITSAELVPPSIEVSPSAGRFLDQQRFDAAVLLPLGAQVTSMFAHVLGEHLPLTFPGTCHLLPPNALGRQAILCPDAHKAVASRSGDFNVTWQVDFADGSILVNDVTWSRSP